MARRLKPLIAIPLLGVVIWSLLFSGTVPAATPPSKTDDAQALRVADLKLAALAKGEAPPQPEVRKKATKKRSQPVRKKRVKKARRSDPAATTIPPAAPAQKALSRRLTLGEVQGILSTTRDFAGADLSGLSLTGQDLSGVNLNRANLHGANLERTDLTESDLELADFSGANLRGASLNQARLRGTRLEGAQMDGALWIDKTVCKSGSVGRCVE